MIWQQPKVYEFHYRGNITIVGGHPYLIPFAGFCAGLGLFGNGFWTYRKLRLIEDTPPIAVRSVPMGLVHVRGKAEGKYLIESPIGHMPCYCYRLVTEKLDTSVYRTGTKKQWVRQWPDKRDARVFSLDDGTGKVLVNPAGAELDLPVTFNATIGDSRYTEYSVQPENEYNVTGTCVENPQTSDEHEQNMILKDANERTFVISGLSERKLDQRLLRRAQFQVVLGGLLMLVTLGILVHNFLAF